MATFSSRENVKVVIRFRPVNKVERAHENDDHKYEPMEYDPKAGNIILGKKRNKIWGFDGVCGPKTNQEDMFNIVAEQTCKDVVNGYNGTIFVYGQTGSGKTYTMYGAEDRPDDVSLMGVIPRCVSYIFNFIENDEDIDTFRVSCSFLEIYQERPRDLLNKAKKQDLRIRLNKRHETYMQGLVEHQVESITDVLQLIEIATKNRVTDSTNMNAVSSRSHMLMKMTVVIKLKDGTIRIANANFADLAGSEKVKKTGAKGTRLDEAKAINKSLSVLGQVISALSTGKAKHVPFRDSLLTHVLRDSLGGNCKTTLVVAVSPHKYNRAETINSLRFGRRCKLVTNKAQVNRVFSNDELMRRLAILEAKNEELQEMLKKKAFDAFQNSELPKQIEALQKELEETKANLLAQSSENENLDNIIKQLRTDQSQMEDKATSDLEKIEGLQAKIVELEGVIETLRNDLEKQKQREEYMNNQQQLLTQKLNKMEEENEERSNEINTLQTELSTLRQFKHDTQQKDIENMMKQEQINTEMTQLKQQMEQQKLQYQQEINIKTTEQLSIQKQLNETKTKNEKLILEQEKLQTEKEEIENKTVELEQEKIKIEQELGAKEKEYNKKIQEITLKNQMIQQKSSEMEEQQAKKRSLDLEEELKRKEEELANDYREREETLINKYEKQQTEKLEKYKVEFQQKQENLENEYKRKDEELINKEEAIRNEIKQELTIQIKNETDQEFNKKMSESREQFASQLSGLQQSLNESHTIQNTMRNELDEERKKLKELQRSDNEKSDKILSMENERESLLSELEQLRKELSERGSKQQTQKEENSRAHEEYKEAMEEWQADKDKILQEKEELAQKLDQERAKIEEIKEEFRRKEELFGAKEKQQINLLKAEKQQKEAIRKKLSRHEDVVHQSHNLLAKQNKLLKQRESKIYNLVEKQEAYLDSMNHLRNIQINMDEDVAKKAQLEEEEAEKKRRAELEAQARKDEEYVRSLLLQEQKKPKGAQGNGIRKKHGKSHSRVGSSYHKMQINDDDIKYNGSHRAESDVEQMMQIANANSKSNLSQQIASVALAQQRDRLMGGKQKKSVLDLWIKSQMQLMCGQTPTLCKKYGIKLNKLENMYGASKPNYQPKFDEKHYLKFRADHYDPKEFDTPKGPNTDGGGGKKKHSKKKSGMNSKNFNPLLADNPNGAEEKNGDAYDPYGHYQNDESSMRVAAKPSGFVAQPQSPIRKPMNGNVNGDYHLDGDLNGGEQNGKKKKKNIGGFFKRKSKGNIDKDDKKSKKDKKKKDKKDKKDKKKSKKDKKKKNKGKNGNDYEEHMMGDMDRGYSAPEQMEFEQDAPPVPFGQYLNQSDMQNFEKIVVNQDQNGHNNNNGNARVELEEEVNNRRYHQKKPSRNQSRDYNNHNNGNGHNVKFTQNQDDNASESNNESLSYEPNDDHLRGYQPSDNLHSVSKTDITHKSTGTVIQHDVAYSREISISMINDNVLNSQFGKQPSVSASQSHISDLSTVQNNQYNNNQYRKPKSKQPKFEAITELKQVGEMAGIIIKSQFGNLNNKKVLTPVLRIQIVNDNVSASPINRIKVRFNKNYIGIGSNIKSVNLPSPINHGGSYTINIPLMLNENESIMQQYEMNVFDYSAELILDTNLCAIKCNVTVPIHLFFANKGGLPRDQFLSQWKSIRPEMESKVQIGKARSSDMEHLKTLLQIHNLFFIHHRTIPNKGNILYYTCKMHQIVLLIEISIALSGKGTVVVRSHDKYKSKLTVNAVQSLIDSTATM